MDKKSKEFIIINAASIFFGTIIGFGVLLGWIFIRSYILGWGDSAPDWYINIQNYIHRGIICITILISAVIGNFLFIRNKLK